MKTRSALVGRRTFLGNRHAYLIKSIAIDGVTDADELFYRCKSTFRIGSRKLFVDKLGEINQACYLMQMPAEDRAIGVQVAKLYWLYEKRCNDDALQLFFGIDDINQLYRIADSVEFFPRMCQTLRIVRDEYYLTCYTYLLQMQYLFVVKRFLYLLSINQSHKHKKITKWF